MSTADLGERIVSFYSLRTRLGRYAFAVLAVAVATALQFGLLLLGPFHQAFILFYPAIVLVAMQAGFGPGILATVLAATSGGYFFLEPTFSFTVRTPEDLVGPTLFALIGVSLTLLTYSRNRAKQEHRESEDRYRDLVEHSEDLVCTHDLEGRLLSVNPAPARVLGYEVAELLQIAMRDLIAPEFREQFDAYLARIKTSGADKGLLCVVTRSGERRIWEYNNTLRTEGVASPIVRGMAHDMTERKRAEAALRASEQRYRMLFEKNIAGVAIASLDGRVLDCNDSWAHILGYNSANEVRGQPTSKFYFNLAEREGLLEELRQKKTFQSREMQLRRKDGMPVWVLFDCGVLLDDKGTPMFQATVIDISEGKQAEALVSLQKEILETIAKGRPLKESLTTLVRLIESQMPGLFASVVLLDEDGLHVRHGAAPSLPEAFAKAVDGAAIGPNAGSCGTAMYRKQTVIVTDVVEDPLWKDYRDLAVTYGLRACWSTPILSGDGKVLGSFAMYYAEPRGPSAAEMRLVEVATHLASIAIERRRAEEALRESEERFRSVYENSTIGIYRTTPDGTILLANPSLVKMLGFSLFSELSQRNLKEEGFQPGYDRVDFQRRLESDGQVIGLEASWTKKDGTAIFVRESAKAIRDTEGKIAYYEGTVEDITDRKRAEEAVRQNEERFRVALKGSPITVFNQDRDRRCTWVYNPPPEWPLELVGKTCDEVIGEKNAAPMNELEQRVLETGEGLRSELTIARNGNRWAFDVTLEPLRDAAGAVIGITGSLVDVARLRELADSLQTAKDQLVQEKAYLESEIQTELGFEEVIGQSSALKEILKKARVVAPTDSTVLLLGETGTGKELVARAVHSLSQRRERNFIKLNCAAVPSGLLESELFGHEKGAFTGAVNQKVGRIELADKGTLFLDEIGELPLELQPKLLRVLQDREFERLGGVHTLRVDVRIIAATNRDLQQQVAKKEFREDLFYRLNVFPIQLPPLRQRRADIPMLVHHFVHKHAARMGKNIEGIPDETLSLLQNGSWPGNIRELENMIERMVILTKGGVLAAPPMELEGPQDLLYDNLTEMEREHIMRVLRETNGVLSGVDGAASRLGIKRTTLQSMLKRLGIDPQEFRRGTGTFGKE
jgi:PAS domain S-box-containing protein